ncbi:MAG: response regulator transcription factor [Saprospiraceae bacterium]|nr:response regulator transcription factor [Saprospiraceae bacterium]
MKIAIIEDDANIQNLIKIIISELNIAVDAYDNGWIGLDAVLNNTYCLLILDIMLPGVNGIEICRKIRQSNTTLPILMLTSKTEEDDKIAGLDIGADDYLTKPFSNGELLARVKSLLRRTGSQIKLNDKANEAIRIGKLVLDVSKNIVTKHGKEINLTSKEFELLHLFMSQAGKNFTRQEVLERVWGEHFEGLEHTVNSNINRLRNKIEDDQSNPVYLVTVWGIGYRFNKNVDQ